LLGGKDLTGRFCCQQSGVKSQELTRTRAFPAPGSPLQFLWSKNAAKGEFLMAITVEAIYENGVLKLDKPLPFKEHAKVNVTVEERQPSLAERIVARASTLPPETLDRLPADGAAQHDHYIYGTPKRPE
jgi:predicted DNA-binding antitoxin AbrB/MazE fold protein